MNVVILIPAHNPHAGFVELLRELAVEDVRRVVVVNDGSRQDRRWIFERIAGLQNVTLLEHAGNKGRGAALKTGVAHVLLDYPDAVGVVTADCDGRHSVRDIMAVTREVAEGNGVPVLGTMTTDRERPLPERIGNRVIRLTMKTFYSLDLEDAWAGLRGIPMVLVRDLSDIPHNRNEFEIEMLLEWKAKGLSIVEIPIDAASAPGDSSTQFSMLLDSMRVYFVLYRYVFVSLVTAAADILVFLLAHPMLNSVLATTYCSRLAALGINYFLARRFVFCSEEAILRTFLRYAMLVAASGFTSAALVQYLLSVPGINILSAKVASDLLLYVAIFLIQRDLVFVEKEPERNTDWARYYESPCRTAHFSRAVTTRRLLANMARYGNGTADTLDVAELGGANSCFYASVLKRFSPRRYWVCDNNGAGLARVREAFRDNEDLHVQECDVLHMSLGAEFDVVFSVGLVEHFPAEDTARAIRAHFDVLKPGGIAIISYPSPTFLYKGTRLLAELLRLWIFHDERPLGDEEVDDTLSECGTVLSREMIWPVCLTQRMVVVRKPVADHVG